MNVETTYTNNIHTETTTAEAETYGTSGMILTLIIVVAAIGYLTNLIKLDDQIGISHWVRAIGACCPPFGAVLGFM